jgi:hypothetical protein
MRTQNRTPISSNNDMIPAFVIDHFQGVFLMFSICKIIPNVRNIFKTCLFTLRTHAYTHTHTPHTHIHTNHAHLVYHKGVSEYPKIRGGVSCFFLFSFLPLLIGFSSFALSKGYSFFSFDKVGVSFRFSLYSLWIDSVSYFASLLG